MLSDTKQFFKHLLRWQILCCKSKLIVNFYKNLVLKQVVPFWKKKGGEKKTKKQLSLKGILSGIFAGWHQYTSSTPPQRPRLTEQMIESVGNQRKLCLRLPRYTHSSTETAVLINKYSIRSERFERKTRKKDHASGFPVNFSLTRLFLVLATFGSSGPSLDS